MMQNFNPDAPTTLTSADIIDPVYLPASTPVTGYDAMTARITNAFMVPSRNNLLDTLKTQQSQRLALPVRLGTGAVPVERGVRRRACLRPAFLFGNFGPSLFSNATNSAANRPGRLALSEAMMASMSAFMRNGDPNVAELGTTWAPWPARLLFDATPGALKISTQ
jgi:para-nitrobenzyl esterase